MPATSNATANMSRRQAFNGKGLTFIEMIFDTEVTETATTPDTKDSAFEVCSQVVEEKGTLLAKSYALGCKATEKDAAIGPGGAVFDADGDLDLDIFLGGYGEQLKKTQRSRLQL